MNKAAVIVVEQKLKAVAHERISILIPDNIKASHFEQAFRKISPYISNKV